MKKIFATHVNDQEFISRIHKECLQFDFLKKQLTIKKRGKRFELVFHKRK